MRENVEKFIELICEDEVDVMEAANATGIMNMTLNDLFEDIAIILGGKKNKNTVQSIFKNKSVAELQAMIESVHEMDKALNDLKEKKEY
jgi:hypothetical protein